MTASAPQALPGVAREAGAASASRLLCWHCGDAMAADEVVRGPLAGQSRLFCCIGCRAAAQWIEQTGLVDYYRLRDAVAAPGTSQARGPRPAGGGVVGDDAADGADPADRTVRTVRTVRTDGAATRSGHGPADARRAAVSDGSGGTRAIGSAASNDADEAVLSGHVVHPLGPGAAEVMLVVDGIRCTACAWLIERLLTAHAGVASVQVNTVSLRARIVFDPARVTLAGLLRVLRRAGYRPLPLERAALDDARGRESRAALKRVLVAGFGMMQAMMFAAVLYVGGDSLDEATRGLFRWLGFAAASPVVLYSARPFFAGAWRALKLRSISVDVPVALAIAVIYGASLWVALRGGVEVYFDSVAMFVFFLLCGRHLEMRARHRAGDLSDSIARLTPAFAERRRQDGRLERVPVAELRAGDRVLVAGGQAIPADGELAQGRCAVDESLLTGESRPVVRAAGAALVAGSLVVEGPVELIVGRVGDDTTLAAILRLVQRAQVTRPRLARAGERAAGAFIARVMVLSGATAAWWLAIDPVRAFDASLAVLVVSCPCAFALAVPAVLTRTMAVLAGRGVLIVRPDAIETLASADRVVFDKTGTITDRHLELVRIDVLDASLTRDEALACAAALARASRHPASAAIATAAAAHASTASTAATAPCEAVDCVDHRGEGVEGRVGGRRLRLGRSAFAVPVVGVDVRCGGRNDSPGRREGPGITEGPGRPDPEVDDDGAVMLAGDTGPLARFHLSESIRRDAEAAVSALRMLGLPVEMASGDAPRRVEAVASQVGIDRWTARMRPDDKLKRLGELRAAGHTTVVVGDGVNDAPVLAGAEVSIAMASGADLAQASSDIVLVGARLQPVAEAVLVARQARALLRQNQRWAMVYNFSAVPLAALGFVPPWLAALGMSASSLFVVLNSLRIGGATTVFPSRRPDATDRPPHGALQTR